MLSKMFTVLLVMALFPSAIQSQPCWPTLSQGVTAREKKLLRIFVEEHLEVKLSAKAATISALLNNNAALYGFAFEWVTKASQTYDAHLIVTTGKGGRWCDHRHFTLSTFDSYYFATAVWLTPTGKTLFVATASQGSAYQTRETVARQILKKLTEHSDALQ
ncbi:MAG: hypothetical protein HY231_10375 [Acidobacteria bacterium]|nr:hypothetical protein [Acidobacteriota bacterium]